MPYKAYGYRRYQEEKRFRRIKFYLILGLLALLCLGVFYLVAYTELFRITSITFAGENQINKTRLVSSLKSQMAGGFWGGLLGPENYFSWNSDLAYSDLQFSVVKIKKDLASRSIEITAQKRESYLAWCSLAEAKQCYWVDSDGFVFSGAPELSGQLILAVSETPADSETPIIIGSSVLPALEFSYLKSAINFFKQEEIKTADITIQRPLSEILASTSAGTEIRLSLRFDPNKSALPALKKLIADNGLNKFVYIDLTAENRALVKFK